MKKYIASTLTVLLSTHCMVAETEVPDTIFSMNNPSTVVITETNNGIAVNVDDNESIYIADYKQPSRFSTSQYTFKFQSFNLNNGLGVNTSSHWDIITGGLNIGMVKALDQPSGLDLQWSKSFEISWLNTLGVRYSHKSISVSLGIGLDWRNYKMTTTDHYMISPGSGQITISPYPDGAHHGGSRIKVFSLGFPLLFTQHIPRTTLALTAGGIFNINTHASLKSTYENANGHKIEEYSEGIGRRIVTFDLYGAITFYKGNGLYIRYSPQSALKTPMTPKFNPLSIGITLFM